MALARPQEILEKTMRFLNAWETLAPGSKFGGLSLDSYKALIQPSLDARAELEAIKAQEDSAMMKRDHNDALLPPKLEVIVAGVIADPEFGNDSALYEAMGYTPKSKQKSGLTRKAKTPKP